MSFSRRIRWGTGANILRQLVNIGTEIAVVPIALAGWGAALYGEWQILGAAMTYIMLLDFGSHTYAINRMNQCYAKGLLDEFARILHTALAIAIAGGGLGLVAAIVFSYLIPVADWANLTITSTSRARNVLLLVALQAALALPVGVIAGVYRAVGEYARDIMISNVYRLVSAIGIAFIIYLNGGILAAAWVQLLSYGAVLLFIVLDIKRRHPGIDMGVKHLDLGLMRSFFVPSSLFFSIQMAGSALIHGMVLILANTVGATAVAVFTVTRTLVNSIPQVTNSISGTLWPEFTVMEVRGDYDKLAAWHQLAAKTIFWLGISAAVFLYYSAEHLVTLWTGSRIRFDPGLLNGLLLLELVTSWCLTSQTLLAAANRPGIIALCQVLVAVFGLGLGYVGALHWGLAGAAWGLFVATLLTTSWIVPFVACRLLNADCAAFTRAVLGRGVGILLGLFTIVGFYDHLWPSSGVSAVTGIWLCTAVFGFCGFRYGWLTHAEWENLKTVLPRMPYGGGEITKTVVNAGLFRR